MSRVFAGLLLSFVPLFAQDADDIVRRSVSKDLLNWSLRRNYTYRETNLEQDLDKKGGVKKSSSEVSEVLIVCGQPFHRTIEKDGRPVSASEKDKQEKKLTKLTAGDDTRSCEKRAADYERRRIREREFLKEVPDAYNLKLLRTELVDGKEAYVISAEPRANYHGKTDIGKTFAKIRATLWIDTTELQWVKIEAETIDTVSFGLFLFRLHPGAHLEFEQARVNQEIWLPKRVRINGSARVGLVYSAGYSGDFRFDDYHKFSTDSRIVSTGEVQ